MRNVGALANSLRFRLRLVQLRIQGLSGPCWRLLHELLDRYRSRSRLIIQISAHTQQNLPSANHPLQLLRPPFRRVLP